MMNLKNKTAFLCAATALSAMALPGAAIAQKNAPERSNSYSGTLSPLNDSEVAGTFTIEQRGQGQIRVMIEATGLEVAPEPHVAHIHGLEGDQKASCPTMAQDDDADGFIELAEGLDTYGPIIIPLGDLDPDNDGIVNYSETFKLNKATTYDSGKSKIDLLPLNLREIVLHGMTLQTGEGANGGEADGTAGYKTVLPVACGQINMDARSKS